MAKRRMFSCEILKSDRFLDLPAESQTLYIQLNLSADDDGFFGGKKSLLRLLGLDESAFTPLVDANFVYEFASGIVVILQWKLHNQIKKDRYTSTIYVEEMATLDFVPGKGYVLKETQDKKTEAPAAQPKPAAHETALPLRDGASYTPRQEEIEEYKRLYPAVDVYQQLRNMWGWLLANPKKQKTAEGVGRFINGWLLNAQNQAANPGWGHLSEKAPPVTPPRRVTTDTASPASYNLEKAILKMNTTVPKLKKKNA